MAARLQRELWAAVGEGWDVLAGPGVTFDRRNDREPDVAVVRSAALSGDRLAPSDVHGRCLRAARRETADTA